MFIKTVIGDVVAHLKPQKNHRFVRFVMYCIITTVPVVCYWYCSDETIHYKYDMSFSWLKYFTVTCAYT